MEDHGAEQLTLFAEASPAKILVRRVKEQELPENVRAYGRSMHESLTRYGLDMSLPKTLHCFELGDLPLSSKTWPKWGMMQDGECWELGTRVRPIKETECGSWPTPCTRDYKGARGRAAQERKGNPRDTLPNALTYWPTPTVAEATKIPAQANYGQIGLNNHPAIRGLPGREKGTKDKAGDVGGQKTRQKNAPLNPSWVEWLMNWPINWTSLEEINNEHFKYWEKAGATALQRSGKLRDLWWEVDPASTSQERGCYEQHTGKHPDSLREVSRDSARETKMEEPQQEEGVSSLRGDIYVQEIEGEILQSELCESLSLEAEEVLPRVAQGVRNRVDRLKAIGNGQVPEVARLAWETLTINEGD